MTESGEVDEFAEFDMFNLLNVQRKWRPIAQG